MYDIYKFKAEHWRIQKFSEKCWKESLKNRIKKNIRVNVYFKKVIQLWSIQIQIISTIFFIQSVDSNNEKYLQKVIRKTIILASLEFWNIFRNTIIFLETLGLLANKRIIKTNDREAIVGWRSNTTLMKQGKRWILMDRLWRWIMPRNRVTW